MAQITLSNRNPYAPVDAIGDAIAAVLNEEKPAAFVQRVFDLAPRQSYAPAAQALQAIVQPPILNQRHARIIEILLDRTAENMRAYRLAIDGGLIGESRGRARPNFFGLSDLIELAGDPRAAIALHALGYVRDAIGGWRPALDCVGSVVGRLPSTRRGRAALALNLLVRQFSGAAAILTVRLSHD